MGRKAPKLELSEEEHAELKRLVRAFSTPQQFAMRARTLLLLNEGLGIGEAADRLGIWRKTVSTWRTRWLSGAGVGAAVIERLRDAPRPGGPVRITAGEVCAIIALACKPPKDCGLPLSHWSASDLARETVKRGLVDRISPRQAGRFLKRSRSQTPFDASLADA